MRLHLLTSLGCRSASENSLVAVLDGALPLVLDVRHTMAVALAFLAIALPLLAVALLLMALAVLVGHCVHARYFVLTCTVHVHNGCRSAFNGC
jgi:hypothetical protein